MKSNGVLVEIARRLFVRVVTNYKQAAVGGNVSGALLRNHVQVCKGLTLMPLPYMAIAKCSWLISLRVGQILAAIKNTKVKDPPLCLLRRGVAPVRRLSGRRVIRRTRNS